MLPRHSSDGAVEASDTTSAEPGAVSQVPGLGPCFCFETLPSSRFSSSSTSGVHSTMDECLVAGVEIAIDFGKNICQEDQAATPREFAPDLPTIRAPQLSPWATSATSATPAQESFSSRRRDPP